MTIRPVRLAAFLACLAGTTEAQLISIKTVPVAQTDQFDIYPSRNLAMGGVSIALDDPLLDPFVNPAKAVRSTNQFYGSPLMYSVSEGSGRGRTLPVAAALRGGRWFGAFSLALQQVDPSRQFVSRAATLPLVNVVSPIPEIPPPDKAHGNTYAYGALGKTLNNRGLSLAASARWADLSAVDGVDLLYAGSSSIAQNGYAGDLRIGLLQQWDGGPSFEILALHNRFHMTHDVTFLDSFWDPQFQRTSRRARQERNFDYSNAWGLHVAYQRPVSETGWRVGGILTSNLMSHPKLPNYDVRTVGIVPIWGDPGNSWAFNVGVGASRTLATSTLAVDVVYEPIWTNTWGETTSEVTAADGRVIPLGGKNIENWFRFSNYSLNMGVDQKILPKKGSGAAIQLGVAVHSVSYHMSQQDYVQASSRSLNEDWVEWAPTWGLSLKFPEMEIRYRGRVTNGTGRPGVVPTFRGGIVDADVAQSSVGSNILVAPTGPVSLGPVHAFNNQISVSFPIR